MMLSLQQINEKMDITRNQSKRITKIETLLIWILKIYLWIAVIIVIYTIFLKITNHSPDAEDIIIALLTITLSAVILIGLTFGLKIGALSSDMKNLSNQFRSLAADFKKHIEKHK